MEYYIVFSGYGEERGFTQKFRLWRTQQRGFPSYLTLHEKERIRTTLMFHHCGKGSGVCFNLWLSEGERLYSWNKQKKECFLWALYECCFYTWKRWGFNAVALYKVCFSDTFPELLWMTGMCFWVVN